MKRPSEGLFNEKKNASDSITARFTGKLVLRNPLFCTGGSPFLMRCLRALFHEETAFLSVRKIPFPELTPDPLSGPDNRFDEIEK
jgi:hypothetical protein